MANGVWFTEEDVRRELEDLGFKDVSNRGLQSFSQELRQLVIQQKSDSVDRSDVTVTDDSATETATKNLLGHDVTTSTDSALPSPALDRVAVKRPCSAVTKTVIQHHPEKENWDSVCVTDQFGKQHLTDHDEYSSSCSSLNESSHRKQKPKTRMPKRKVLRKKNGEARVFDESICESEPSGERPIVRAKEDITPSSDRDQLEVPKQDMERVNLQAASVARPPSFIRPIPPLTISQRKSDPVARYHDYRHFWSTFRVPGEDNRDSLRWNIREQLLHQDPLPYSRPRRMLQPGNYIPPPDKKRQALRWEIRHTMAAQY